MVKTEEVCRPGKELNVPGRACTPHHVCQLVDECDADVVVLAGPAVVQYNSTVG